MEITGLDFVLINILSYMGGVATGLIICCKNKDKLLVKSRSIEGLSGISSENQVQYSAPVMASAPPDLNKPVKITLE